LGRLPDLGAAAGAAGTGSGRSGNARAATTARRAGASQPGEGASQAAVRSDRHLVHRPAQLGEQLALQPGGALQADARVHYDAAKKAQAEGKVYHDDIGQCWPAGLPIIMTRVWPIAMIQQPTAIYMISGFMNSLRTVYLDGRPHSDPDIVVPSFNGESIGKWEGDTLVVDTKYFVNDHHWIDSGIPASDQLHIVERIKLVNNGNTLEIAYAMTDPKGWEGEWKVTKRWTRVEDTDIAEVSCLPDLNQHMPSTQSTANVR
jgi:hypothetical protein